VYNFCVAVDDALMEISHVIRAEEHLPNSLRQVSGCQLLCLSSADCQQSGRYIHAATYLTRMLPVRWKAYATSSKKTGMIVP